MNEKKNPIFFLDSFYHYYTPPAHELARIAEEESSLISKYHRLRKGTFYLFQVEIAAEVVEIESLY